MSAQVITPERKVWRRAELARVIDHTLLDPAATNHEVLMACEIARRNQTATVCLNSNRVALAAQSLEGSDVGIAAVVGFPFGAAHVTAKSHEARLAIDDGATEIDMVIDIGRLKDGEHDAVRSDIASVVDAAAGHTVKVIIECSRLTEDEKRTACRLAVEAGASFIKTSTGYLGHGATIHDVTLIRAVVGPRIGIKASGAILYYEDAVAMLTAGATRLGMSHTQQVLDSIPVS
ncbi:MAG TPA: deoxyribose-phosphate aldolase [Candidatus Dormibacteraeota bacterium]|nr:deoxyribose-phosphate aldolase [Candidatus Dormibacteraeota bacterium]